MDASVVEPQYPARPPLRKRDSFAQLLQGMRVASPSHAAPKAVRRTKSFVERLREAAHPPSEPLPPLPPVPPRMLARSRSFGNLLCGLGDSTGQEEQATDLPTLPAIARTSHWAATQAKPKKSDVAAARRVFDDSQVLNFTNVQYQFFSSIETDIFGTITGVTYRERPVLDHIVNKWERAEQGESLPGYSGESRTASEEAAQLGLPVGEYKNLPARQKMQFAFLARPNDIPYLSRRGYGTSYFVISKPKCMEDGYIHLGDSSVGDFPLGRGPYRSFRDRLKDDAYAVKALNQNSLADAYAPVWIEVTLKGGVALPGDIEKFVVSERELDEIKGYIPVAEAKEALNKVYAGKIEYR